MWRSDSDSGDVGCLKKVTWCGFNITHDLLVMAFYGYFKFSPFKDVYM